MKNQNTKSYQIYLLLRQNTVSLEELKILLQEEDIVKIIKVICSSLKEIQEDEALTYFENLIKTVTLLLEKCSSSNIGCCLDTLKKMDNKLRGFQQEKIRETIDILNELLLQKLNVTHQNNQYDFLMSIIYDIRNIGFLKQILNTYPHYVNARNSHNQHIAFVLLDQVLGMLESNENSKEISYIHQVILEFFKRNRFHIFNTESDYYTQLITAKIERLPKKTNYRKKLSYYLSYVNCLLNKRVTQESLDSVMDRHNVSQGFSNGIQEELTQLQEKDYIITIDDKDTLDLDDALSIRRVKDHYHLKIYIADVQGTVKIGSQLDTEAYRRAESIYLSDRTIPMLPVELSNIILSLNSYSYKSVWRFEVDIYDNREIANFEIAKDYIHIDRKLSYQEVDNILSFKQIDESSFETLYHLSNMASILRSQGSDKTFHRTMEEYIDYQHWIESKKSNYKNRTKSEIIVEESMILLNFLLADYCCKKGYPMIYRVHEQPSTTAEYNRLMHLRKLIESEYTTKENFVKIINSLMAMYPQAYYSTSNIGHFGLGLSHYCHGTSPIRRYPDIVVQRILQDYAISLPTKDKDIFYQRYNEEVCAYCNEQMKRNVSFQEEYEITKSFLKDKK